MSNNKNNRNRLSKRKPKLPNKFNDHVMGNLSQKRNDSADFEELEAFRVNTEGIDGKIRGKGENSKEVVKEGIDCDDGEACMNAEVSRGIMKNDGMENVVESKGMSNGVFGIRDSSKGQVVGDIDVEEDSVRRDSEVPRDVNSGMPEPFTNCDKDGNNTDNYNAVNEDNSNIESREKSYANKMSNGINVNNDLFFIPTGKNENGEKVVVFDEELVKEGSEKWKFTVCGYFVGYKIGVNELRYNTRRMWGRHGLKDCIVDADGMCYFKFKHEDGMNYVIDQSPWVVNGKPFLVQKWEPETVIIKESPCKIPIWIRLLNIPLEEWSVRGISALISRLGRPIKMDQVTADMCRAVQRCDAKPKPKPVVNNNIRTSDGIPGNQEGFVEVRHRKNQNIIKQGWNRFNHGSKKQQTGVNMGFRPKEPCVKPIIDKQEGTKKGVETLGARTTPKKWNVGQENVAELRKSANKYVVLSKEEDRIELERKENEGSDEEDVFENEDQETQSFMADEILGNDCANGVFLPYLISDHSPSIMSIPRGITKKKKSFRFANYIADKDEFLELVNEEWKHKVSGCQMYKVVQRLKLLKKPLNKLNWQNGNIFERVNTLKEKLKVAQSNVDVDPFNLAKRQVAVNLVNEYTKVAEDELKLLHQKAKIQWLKEGDKNSAYFHNILKARKNKSRIENICCEYGGRVEEALDMIKEVSDIEIKEALFDIDSSKAAGPDGYTSCFFKKAWGVTGANICLAVREFFISGRILREINATVITLVPKANTPKKISDFRPIACWNVIYKCISKILTNRIKDGLSKVSLDDFSDVSGLFPNLSKSTIFFGSISETLKEDMLRLLPFKCGKLPMKYLGVPLLAKRIRVKDCQSLIDNVENRITCWRNKFISYVGRIQLIASVLSAMHQYWASVYMIPTSATNELEKIFKRFLWNSSGSAKRKAKVAWKNVCRPKVHGESLWVKWVSTVKLKGKSIWEAKIDNNDSHGWKELIRIKDKIKPYVIFKIGDGKFIFVWHDKWCDQGSSDRFIQNKDIYDVRISNEDCLVDAIVEERWKWADEWSSRFPE
nr:RNA-directed DNA polymerase, eukaryota, reverse transcriptase zinc-binding domain protein [Tanacetum cinerariifolium]